MATNMSKTDKTTEAMSTDFHVAALYHFTPLNRFADLREPIQSACDRHGVKGTLLLASEGINGTIAGFPGAIADVLHFLRSIPELSNLEHKESRAQAMPFNRMKVRLKKEIVTMGVEGIDPWTRIQNHFANFPTGCATMRACTTSPKSPCIALAASAARRQRLS